MADIAILNNQEVLGKNFTVYGDLDNPLFLAKDVAEWIENKNVSQMLNVVDDDEKAIYNVYTPGGDQDMWFLTEYGLYEVLMQSRKPIAKQFKKEVKAILKQLRKTGVVMTETATQEANTYEFLFGRRRIRNTIRKSNNHRALFESFMELSKIERDAHRIDNDDRIRVCEVFMDELENNLANEAVNMRGSELLAIQELLTDLAKEKNRLSNKKNGGIKSNMTMKINDLEQQNQELKQQIEDLTPPEHEWITCPTHGFSENYRLSWSSTGQVVRSKAYNRWISMFPDESVPDREYYEQHGIDFNKEIAIEIGYICKEEFDAKNFDKATIDMIFNHILGIDDNIVTHVTSYRLGTCDTYNEGKIIFTIYNK